MYITTVYRRNKQQQGKKRRRKKEKNTHRLLGPPPDLTLFQYSEPDFKKTDNKLNLYCKKFEFEILGIVLS